MNTPPGHGIAVINAGKAVNDQTGHGYQQDEKDPEHLNLGIITAQQYLKYSQQG